MALGPELDGAEIRVHNSAQDPVANMMKRGRPVIYGDVGKAFMYGSKGGEVYVMGNAAGRLFVFAVGSFPCLYGIYSGPSWGLSSIVDKKLIVVAVIPKLNLASFVSVFYVCCVLNSNEEAEAIIMIEKLQHKFQNQLQITYAQYYQRIYSGLVEFYRELEKTVPDEQLKAALRTWSERSSIESVGDLRVADFEEFKDYWQTVSCGNHFFHLVTVEFPHETKTELHCKYTECLFAKTFRELGAEDFGRIIVCDADHIFIQTMNPNLRLERSKTLMEGHDLCNHTFIWEE